MKEQLKYYRDALLGSYSQIFFTTHQWLGVILIVTSFIDPAVGLSGLICAGVNIALAQAIGFDRSMIRNGSYTYNALLTGLSLAVYFQFDFHFVLFLVVAAFLTLFITVWMASITSRFGLPFLSIPFILCVWILLLNARTFEFSWLAVRSDEAYHNAHNWLGPAFCTISEKLQSGLPSMWAVYFKSMGGILFQWNIFAGILVTAGVLLYSRIAFSLSLLGFFSGYLFFRTVHSNLPDSEFAYSSFNYVFSALALGGFLFIPSVASYLLTIVSALVTGFMLTALFSVTSLFYLPLFSLPFSLATLLLLSALHKRYFINHLQVVQYQLFSPEKNLYAYHTYMERFKSNTYVHIQLPFYSEWFVSQGHGGKITHKDDWQYAWDFVVTDEEKHTFRFPGKQLSDFYCYNLPVLSPADGIVVTLFDEVEDNKVGGVNLANNWGNTIIIKHTEFLYSKISHLKQGSFKVKTGDRVKKGEMLALCGNSGRSPEPHIHFQLQGSAFIGAKTLKYPISYYISRKEGKPVLHSFDYPEEGETIYRPMPNALLHEAFRLVPGMKLRFKVSSDEGESIQTWEVFTDAYNLTYLYCHTTKSIAYFTNNDTLFYFTSFTGDKGSLLYYFYLAAYKVILSHVPGLEITDTLLINGNYHGPAKFIQDLVAPFRIFIKPQYRFAFAENGEALEGAEITIRSSAGNGRRMSFTIGLAQNKINTFNITHQNKWLKAEHID